ncbi:nuclear nucleic acid-binding protein C1D [Scaptodrosophila lebanonensis]|uniref:Nuclear nucleic acid-binding protein C1D n=1 Tax=Drosophila lebanonensis TaxID=7225 RepID=A0A6J2TV83_DROLE|nr:nuclear nucleic acid-binding protein C1D [Scaptodrosophila lebanonensis]
MANVTKNNKKAAHEPMESKTTTVLGDDDKILGVVDSFTTCLDAVERDLDRALQERNKPMLTLDEMIKLDTYIAYVNSTLVWMHAKMQGADVTNHPIQNDLNRAKKMLARNKEIDDALAAPRLEMQATKRFIAAGIHTRFVNMDGVMVTEEMYKRKQAEKQTNKS